jgi:hypothetical protein
VSLFDRIIGKKPEVPLPIETEPIVAYRSWKLISTPEGIPILHSSVQDFCWPPFEAVSGNVDAGEGIYSFKSQNDAWQYCDPFSVAGEVFLWGKIDEHAEGFRAEFAYPKELWVSKDFDAAKIVQLEETYGVSVVIKEEYLPISHRPSWGATTGNTLVGPNPVMQFHGMSSGIMEFVRDVIYDREALHGSILHLFCLPCGQMTYDADGKPFLKSFERTNMVQAGQIPAPNTFVIQAIRCVFLEKDGSPVPISDPIYWETRIELRLLSKTYCHSLTAYVADPAILLGATDWSKIPVDERVKLIELVANKTISKSTTIAGLSVPISIDGVKIEQQMSFSAIIDGYAKWQGNREVLVALEGISGRAVV